MIDESYLICNNIETANRSQRDEFFSLRTGAGWEDCSNGQNCQNCHKIFNYSYATTCTDCSYCDSDNGKCKNCLACDSAENGKYGELYECYDCSNCQNILYDLADSCSQCSFCNAANVTTIENGLTCSNCSQCDETKCYSCYDCGTEDEICNECDGTGPTNCKTRQDFELCKKVIDCIAFNEGEACEIEEILPLPWENGMRFSSLFSNILTNCLTKEAKKGITNVINQKICNYDTSKINFIQDDYWFFFNSLLIRPYFVSDSTSYVAPANLVDMLTSNSQYSGVTGENKGILFNDCGTKKISEPFSPPNNEIIYSSDPEIFSPLSDPPTTPRTPEGDIPVNLKVIVSNVSWNEMFENDCSYNVYLCAQEAIATYEDDPILYLYRNFSYFNESNYTVQIKNWTANAYGYQVNVTAIKYPKLSLNLGGRNADISHIAKAFIAGLRDYFIFNSNLNQTINFFCINSGLYPDWKTCYENNISVLINDNVPWNLTSFNTPIDTFSSLPDFKYIYYDSSKTSYNMDFNVELTFFVYTSNISLAPATKLNNTIFVSPVLVITPTAECVNHDECSQKCSSLCPPNVYGCCFGCMLGQCIGGQCKCVDATTYCSSSPPYQVGSECTKQCSSYTSDTDCTNAGCRWCPSYGGIENGCGDSSDGWWDPCVGSYCYTTAQCTNPTDPLPTCTWTDLWVGFCWGCCSATNTCTVPASMCY